MITREEAMDILADVRYKFFVEEDELCNHAHNLVTRNISELEKENITGEVALMKTFLDLQALIITDLVKR